MTDFDPDAYLDSHAESAFDPDAYLSQAQPSSAPSPVASSAPANTWMNAAKGVGEAALGVGSAGLKAVNKAVNDLLPGQEGRARVAQEIETDPVLNYHPGPEAAPIMNALETVATPIRKASDWAHSTIEAATNKRTADVVGDVATVASSYGALGEKAIPGKSQQAQALEEGQKLGYVVPPATTNPTFANNLAEGLAGKISTAQKASVKNQEVTNGLVRQEFGLPENAPLTHETMEDIRAAQGKVYQAVGQVPDIKFGASYEQDLDKLAVASKKLTSALPNYKGTGAQQVQQLIDSLKPANGVMDGETAVELSKNLRSEARSYQVAADRMGDPQARLLSRTYRGAAEAVENAVEDHLDSIGQGKLASQWDQARRTIAKTHSVENALDGAGNVDALKLGKQLLKGKPLSDNLEAAAQFANAFPKAARNIKESLPGVSPLDYYAGALTEAATGSPTGLFLGPVRAGVRSALLRAPGQWMARPGNMAIPPGLVRSVPALNQLGPPVAPTEQQNEKGP